jgi:HD-like signal output (HDOD) protein
MSWFKRARGNSDEPKPVVEKTDSSARAVTDLEDELAIEREQPAALADLFLVFEEHLTEIELEDLNRIVASIPRPPPLIDRLTRGLDDPDELREAVLSSPSLSADVLRVVNSAAFALRSPITSIEHAVTYLGVTMVKGLVLQGALSQVMSFENEAQQAAYMRIWRSSYVASAAAQDLVNALAPGDPTVIATRALLANIGDLALIFARPELSALYAPNSTLLSRVEAQQDAIMANSAVLSSRLAREWQLPEELYTALRYSLSPLTWAPEKSERSEEEQKEDVMLYLACRIGDAVSYGRLTSAEQFDLLREANPDYFNLPDYLRCLDLGELLIALRDPGKTRRLERTISQLS